MFYVVVVVVVGGGGGVVVVVVVVVAMLPKQMFNNTLHHQPNYCMLPMLMVDFHLFKDFHSIALQILRRQKFHIFAHRSHSQLHVLKKRSTLSVQLRRPIVSSARNQNTNQTIMFDDLVGRCYWRAQTAKMVIEAQRPFQMMPLSLLMTLTIMHVI